MSTIEQPPKGDFAAVDDDPSPEALVALLDAAQGVAQEYKEHALSLLRLEPGMRALDVGCGAGHDLVRLAAYVGAEGSVVGVDASRLMLDHAAKRLATIATPAELHFGSVHTLPFADRSFAAVRADRVLHFLDDAGRAIAEMVRVVHPGGRIVVSEPDHDTIVLDAGEPALTGRLLDFRRQRALPTPGRRLRRLFIDAALGEVEVCAHAGIVTDFREADAVLRLSQSARAAVEAGVLSMAEGLAWLSAAARDSAAGRFLAAMTIFTVCGTRVSEQVRQEP